MDKLLKQIQILLNSPTLVDSRTGKKYVVTGFDQDGSVILSTPGATRPLRVTRLDGFTIYPPGISTGKG